MAGFRDRDDLAHIIPSNDTHIYSPKLWPGIQTLTRNWHFKLMDAAARKEVANKVSTPSIAESSTFFTFSNPVFP